MIEWASQPDPVFYDIISNALEYYQDGVKELFNDDDDEIDNNVVKLFGKEGLTVEVEKIIAAHKSTSTFTVTDYHFLILYDALLQFCELFNDDMFGEIPLGGIRPSELDFDQIVDLYFFDTDFLFDPETINGLSIEQKDNMAISPVVFSIANSLTPHADELKIAETDEELAPEYETIYVDGEPYPYLDEFDED